MEEIQFPPQEGDQAELQSFSEQVHARLIKEHTELVEKHLSILEDTDPYGRLYAATSLHAIMDLIDSRNRLNALKAEQLANDHRKLA